MDDFVNFYSTYINEEKCFPENAACLMLDIEPYSVVCELYYSPGEFFVQDDRVRLLADTLKKFNLRTGGANNLFSYVNYACKQNYIVSTILLEYIQDVHHEYMQEDQENFIENYPYLSREMGLKIPAPGNKKINTNTKLTSAQKIAKWQETYVALKKINPNISQADAAKKIIDELKKSDPRYIMNSKGEYLSIEYIKKNLKC